MFKQDNPLIEELRRYGLTNGSRLGHHMGIMDNAADALEKAENTVSPKAEFLFLLNFVQQNCLDLDEERCRDHLRMLWTAFCLHQDFDPDTRDYDVCLLELWAAIQETGNGASVWEDKENFENFMCSYLV